MDDMFDEMISVLEQIRDGNPGTESDIIPIKGTVIRDGFMKIGIMLMVAANVSEETVLSFTQKFYRQQLTIQDKS